MLYREAVTKTFKTFLATYKPAGGLIRVVLVREDDGWVAFFCTDPAATVAQVLGAVADRAAMEQDFHDLKEVHGAGQQQLRRYWANVAVYHLNLWLHTLVELWAWRRAAGPVVRPAGQPVGRPGASAFACGSAERPEAPGAAAGISALGRRRPLTRKIRALFRGLLNLIA